MNPSKNGTGPAINAPAITAIFDETPPNDSRIVVFAIKSVLFKANFGAYYTILYLWSSSGWQLFLTWGEAIPEQEVYNIAAKTAGEFNLPL